MKTTHIFSLIAVGFAAWSCSDTNPGYADLNQAKDGAIKFADAPGAQADGQLPKVDKPTGTVDGKGLTLDGPAKKPDALSLCQKQANEYQIALAKAKVCEPQLPVPQCLIKVLNKLDCCACTTFVDSSHQQELQLMTTLEKQWLASCKNCVGVTCAPCAPYKTGQCVPTSSTPGGKCADKL